MTSNEIRQQFLRFFDERDHRIVRSSPVVPLDDPTLMFANAGMNQFKDVFLGSATLAYRRAADTQKCIRAGGKHNDLDDVGHDTYHHTFFEMLGNWSFGDYFKREAIEWAWELLTQVYGIDKSRLHATYFQGDEGDGLSPDHEARDLWLEVTDLRPDQVHPFGKKDNFWEMADVGPCGPCSEIHVDMTPDRSGAGLVNADDPRVFEVWNLVFIQFNRDPGGGLTQLPACHVDTGMGLERLSAVLQGKNSNYDTDLFLPILKAISRVTGAPAYQGTQPSAQPTADEWRDVAYRIVADHIRCLCFAVTDGALPDNEGRGYVLRRILRRAYRAGRQHLGIGEPFLYRLVPTVVELMQDAFPELGDDAQRVALEIREEERSFARTLDHGLKLFQAAADSASREATPCIAGEIAFKLHDTYGFPIDLTVIMAEERQLEVDVDHYEQLMEEARERARAGGKSDESRSALAISQAAAGNDAAFFAATTTDDSHRWHETELESRMVGWVDAQGQLTDTPLTSDEECAVVLQGTCFYSEQGGQVGDRGQLLTPHGTFKVLDTQKVQETVLHIGRLTSGRLEIGQARCQVDAPRRQEIMANHTSTHFLNLALRQVLGDHVQQKGSLVDAAKTRFDFSHSASLSVEECADIESKVADGIAQDLEVYDSEIDLETALSIQGIRAVFGEKYPPQVRVVAIGVPVSTLVSAPGDDSWRAYSVELCGGTHLARSGEIGHFVLVSEDAVAKGIRRLVGLSGWAARTAEEKGRQLLSLAQGLTGRPQAELAEGVAQVRGQLAEAVVPLVARHRIEEKLNECQLLVRRRQEESSQERGSQVQARAHELLQAAERINGTALVVGTVPDAAPRQLRQAMDSLRQEASSAAVVLVATGTEKVTILAGLSKDLVEAGLDARHLVAEVAGLLGGGGNGRADLAQGGGRDLAKVPDALARATSWVREQLAAD